MNALSTQLSVAKLVIKTKGEEPLIKYLTQDDVEEYKESKEAKMRKIWLDGEEFDANDCELKKITDDERAGGNRFFYWQVVVAGIYSHLGVRVTLRKAIEQEVSNGKNETTGRFQNFFWFDGITHILENNGVVKKVPNAPF